MQGAIYSLCWSPHYTEQCILLNKQMNPVILCLFPKVQHQPCHYPPPTDFFISHSLGSKKIQTLGNGSQHHQTFHSCSNSAAFKLQYAPRSTQTKSKKINFQNLNQVLNSLKLMHWEETPEVKADSFLFSLPTFLRAIAFSLFAKERYLFHPF